MNSLTAKIVSQRLGLLTFLSLFVLMRIGLPNERITLDTLTTNLYPKVNETRPNLPSPLTTDDGREFVIAQTKDNKFAVMDVTLGNDRGICRQLVVDSTDFPTLATTGLHSVKELAQTKMITGRSLAEITDLGRPGQLSEDGFMSAKEDILSLLKTDNAIVRQLGFTHPQMAKPLFHLLNMMDNDLALERWNRAEHEWQNIPHFYYNDQKVYVEAHDTKGGQLSIFDDGIEGAFWIIIKRDVTAQEKSFLAKQYDFLTAAQRDTLHDKLSTIYTGEMEPQYIMRYGFYEGHSGWRTDPIAIAFIFGLKPLAEIEASFPGRLFDILTADFTRDFTLGVDNEK